MVGIINFLLEQWAVLTDAWFAAGLLALVVFFVGRSYGRHTMKERLDTVKGQNDALKARVDEYKEKLSNVPPPPPPPQRDPDGVYQHDVSVGTVTGPSEINAGRITFTRMKVAPSFDPQTEFEYRDMVLYIEHIVSRGGAFMPGYQEVRLDKVTCRVTGRRSS